MYKIKEYKIRGKKHLKYKNLEEALKAMAELEGYGGEKQVYKHKGFDIKINKDGEDFQATLFFVNIKDGLEGIRRGHYIVNKDLKSFLEEEREKCIEKYMEIKKRDTFIDMDSKKLFVGGYYDSRIFDGSHFDGKTPFSKDIDTYTLEEVLKLGFVESIKDLSEENLIDLYEKVYNKDLVEELKKRGTLEKDEEDLFFFDFDDFTDEEKKDLILNWTSTDEIAGLEYFETEEEAEKYKNEVLEEITDIEKNIIYKGKIQDDYGCFREVYVYKDDLEEYENKN